MKKPQPNSFTGYELLTLVALAAVAVLIVLSVNGCVAVQSPDGSTALALGFNASTAKAVQDGAASGGVSGMIAALLGTVATGAIGVAAHKAGAEKGWDDAKKSP